MLCLGLRSTTARTVLDILSDIFPIVSSIIDKQPWWFVSLYKIPKPTSSQRQGSDGDNLWIFAQQYTSPSDG